MIKKSLCVIALFTCIAAPCHARWGWTYEKCVEFYGKPEKSWKNAEGHITKARFRRADEKRDVTITAIFAESKCTSATYCCTDNSFMSTETLYAVLRAYEDDKKGIRFVPLEMLAAFTEEELLEQKDLLKRSIKEQIWYLAGSKGESTLYAVFNRDAQMLSVREVKVKDGKEPKVAPKKPMGF